MKLPLRLTPFLLIALAFTACKKNDVTPSETPLTTENLQVPNGFSWEMSENIDFRVTITDTRFATAGHVISIYYGNPEAGGKLLAKGAAYTNKPFKNRMMLAKTMKELYLVKTAPNGVSVTQKIQVTGNFINVAFGVNAAVVAAAGKEVTNRISGSATTTSAGPDNSTGCDESVTAGGKEIRVSGGKTICVGGKNQDFDVDFGDGGGTLRIFGTNLTLDKVTHNTKGAAIRIIVTETGSVTFPDLKFNSSEENVFENYGTATFTKNLDLPGTLVNYGTLNIEGSYNANSDSKAKPDQVNYGIIHVEQNMEVSSVARFTNNGKVTVDKKLEITQDGVFVNNCYLWVKEDFVLNNLMQNHGYIRDDGKSHINANLEMYDLAMLKTKDIVLTGTITGSGKTSLVKVTDKSQLNNSGIITGAIQFCDETIQVDKAKFLNGAAVGCDLNIEVTDCNPEGNGEKLSLKDTDKDGIVDSKDEYPLDPDKAFNTPAAFGTLAFEDMWPKRGDYDMNDVVISYNYNLVTNANNEVVKVNAVYVLYATGGDFNNGFGVEFPIARSKVSAVTGAKLEEGQEKAVIAIFTDMRSELGQWNTMPGKPVSAPKVYTVSFVTAPIPLDIFGMSSYNPFIWNGSAGFGRGYEIHLPGGTPTNLFDTKLFGTVDDDSKNMSKTFVTAKGLPWGIDIPVTTFSYPVEGADISNTYLKLAEWARSGGVKYPDWYSNTEPAYREPKNLYAGK